MKKILLLIIVIFLMTTVTFAETDKIHVTAVGEFDTVNPSRNLDVKVLENSQLGKYTLKAGDIIHCKVVKVTDPKRGKKSASFTVCPTSYTSNGETVTINEFYYGKYAAKILSKEEIKNIDKMQAGKKAAVTVGGFFVKGLAPAVSMAKGIAANEDGNRIESGIKQVYKDSPLSYVEKGQELDLDSNDKFYLIFKVPD